MLEPFAYLLALIGLCLVGYGVLLIREHHHIAIVLKEALDSRLKFLDDPPNET